MGGDTERAADRQDGYVQSDALGTLSLRENVVYKSHDGYATTNPNSVKRAAGASWHVEPGVNMTAVRWQPTRAIT